MRTSVGVETFNLPSAKFQVNVDDRLTGALREGVVIGALQMLNAVPTLRDGSLVRVVPDSQLQTLSVYASRQYLDAKIGTFAQFLGEYIPPCLLPM